MSELYIKATVCSNIILSVFKATLHYPMWIDMSSRVKMSCVGDTVMMKLSLI
jgi:hypothetical protein